MNYYQEISLLRDAEVSTNFLWQKLYPQIHLALVENKCGEHDSAIGVAFPEYDADEFLLGTKLRLFAETEPELDKLNLESWLNRLSDYVQLGAIRAVPDQVLGYASFRQIKPKGSREKLARRRAKRSGESFEQALAYFESYEEERSRLPFIHMKSESNGQHFQLFIEKQVGEQPQKGLYSSYGLSGTSTVPMF